MTQPFHEQPFSGNIVLPQYTAIHASMVSNQSMAPTGFATVRSPISSGNPYYASDGRDLAPIDDGFVIVMPRLPLDIVQQVEHLSNRRMHEQVFITPAYRRSYRAAQSQATSAQPSFWQRWRQSPSESVSPAQEVVDTLDKTVISVRYQASRLQKPNGTDLLPPEQDVFWAPDRHKDSFTRPGNLLRVSWLIRASVSPTFVEDLRRNPYLIRTMAKAAVIALLPDELQSLDEQQLRKHVAHIPPYPDWDQEAISLLGMSVQLSPSEPFTHEILEFASSS